MLHKHEDYTKDAVPAVPQEAVQTGENKCESARNVRRVVVSEESAAISLPNAPWDDDDEV